MDKKNLDKLINDSIECNLTLIKIGKKKTNNNYNLNLSKNIFDKLLELFLNNSKKYNSYYSYKYYNYSMDIYQKKRLYSLKETKNWYELFKTSNINIIGINSNNIKIEPIDYPSISDYHNIEFIEEITITIKNNIVIHYQIKNDNLYQIYLSFNSDKDILKLKNDLEEIINTINFVINSYNTLEF